MVVNPLPRLPELKRGTRTIIAGKTGCGKTTLACYLLANRSTQHWVIFNPKHTKGYSSLPDCVVMNHWDEKQFDKEIEDHRFVILNFGKGETNDEFMDDTLMYIHENFEDIGVCIDELYYLHNGGKCGEGLIGLLTRGRELTQTFLGLMQRPAWVSRFCFSESDNIVGMGLNLRDDRKRMVDNTGHNAFHQNIENRHWLWYNVDSDTGILWGPVPV